MLLSSVCLSNLLLLCFQSLLHLYIALSLSFFCFSSYLSSIHIVTKKVEAMMSIELAVRHICWALLLFHDSIITEDKVLTCLAWLHFWGLVSDANSLAILPRKEKDHNNNNNEAAEDDRISKLPDDIMLTLLAHLGMKEAARTSILSKTWRSLWTKSADLDFDYLNVVPQHPKIPLYRGTRIQVDKYINWVNQVVGMHSGPSIDKFRVSFWFSTSDYQDIERWVKFALSKKVKNLELELFSLVSVYKYVYTLGLDVLKPASNLLDSGIRSLTSLHLNNVDVSGEFLEFVLSECHFLERLLVYYSKQSLVKLKVASDKLKQLTIQNCICLQEFEIHAVNLNRLEYRGHAIIGFKSLPAITDASFGGLCCTDSASVPICQQIACFSMQLSKLSLDFSQLPWDWDHDPYSIPHKVHMEGFPCFSNVRCLEVCFTVGWDSVGVASLVEACPVVQEIKFEFSWYVKDIKEEAYELQEAIVEQKNDTEEEVEEEENYKIVPNTNLRVLEVVDFKGCSKDVDFLLYILKLAPLLQTFICHPMALFLKSNDIDVVRSRAHKLSKILPPQADLVIV